MGYWVPGGLCKSAYSGAATQRRRELTLVAHIKARFELLAGDALVLQKAE